MPTAIIMWRKSYDNTAAEIDLFAKIDYEHEAEIVIANKEEIAMIISEKEFKKFCQIWHEIHGE